ncbi:sulfurtransferase complex subunit TusB [Pseudomonas schmalbachii]|uniref:Sulfurtransferase complex subunit TusB n=1 Tax=Pseudomonas schmalbachii TaxID=2816993 RepID=A0ABS3TKK6_9PSED|nr:sulfurtransferase complex subunit TusB [Pseudomonas schmalbachii]MBO3274179.1 sulfurtransferase complex subunit TusB [Pseudomonas schmalbachii]
MMATLHLLSHSPFNDGRLASCLHLLGPDDGVLLSGEAVHALRAGTAPCQALELMPAGNALFALLEDLQARGLDDVPARVVALDYPGFVELCTRFDKVNAWL